MGPLCISRQILVAATDAGLVDLTAACDFADMKALVQSAADGLVLARAALNGAPRINIATVTFLSPLPRPEQLRGCLVFEAPLINAFANAREVTGPDFAIPQVW